MRTKLTLAFLGAMWSLTPACSSTSDIGTRCVNNDTLCACDHGNAEENDVSCSKEAFPGGLCCAYEGWPSKSATCTCAPVACRASGGNGSCACQLDIAGDSGLASCTAPPGGACCIDAASSLCACSANACRAPDVEVADCTPARITGCAPGNDVVASCR